MTVFWVVIAVMLLSAVWFVIAPLAGKVSLGDADQDNQNILIAKEQMKDLEKERADGNVSETEYHQRKDDLQKALISNVNEFDVSNEPVQKKVHKLVLLFVFIIVSSIALPVYFSLGSSELVVAENQQTKNTNSSQHSGSASNGQASMNDLVANLALRLEADPTNIKGWQMLGRSYTSMRRFKEAADVYAKLYSLLGDQPGVLLAYADALAMSRDGKISGMPFQLVMTALNKEPNNTTALWLAGLGYSEKGEYKKAIRLWEKLLPLFSGNKKSQDKVKHLISKANLRLGSESIVVSEAIVVKESKVTSTMKAAAPFIMVNVSLSKEFRDKAQPDDLVFIYAKASQGPPMPLAAVRKRVSDLPITVRLDDSMAMMPQMKLSSFSVVNVGARISKSGSPIGQKGDLQGIVKSIESAAGVNVEIVINTVK